VLYVLDCEPGAELVLGWTRDTSREEYERRVADGTLGEILRRVPVHAGDVFYLPAGTLHAIGAGIRIFETQQASDLTYRIFDWNRTGADGKPRELHVEKAADVLDYRATFPAAVRTLAYEADGIAHTLLIADARFAVEHVSVTRGDAYVETDGRPLAITAMNAHLRVDADERAGALLEPWQTVVTPASAERVALVPGGEPTSALLVRPQPDRPSLRARAAAHADESSVSEFLAQFGASFLGRR
jgi:mannose-6-phosphate isomerase